MKVQRRGVGLIDKFGTGLVGAVLSLPLGPGLGHAVLGWPKRGALWLALVLGCFVGMVKSIWLLPIAAAIFVAGMLDAFVLGVRKREQPMFQWTSPWVFVLPAISLVCLLSIRHFVVQAFKAGSVSMSPTLHIGDRIFVDKLGTPKRGDVIVFSYPCDPRRDYLFRLIADAGDTVEVRCGVVYVNGHALEQKLVEKPETCSYNDYDERMGKAFKRGCVGYRETNGSRTYEVFGDPNLTIGVAANNRDYPQRGAEPMCFGADGDRPRSVEYKLVETKPGYEAKQCEQQRHVVVPAGHVFVLGDNRQNANDSRIWGALPRTAIKGRVIGIWASTPPGEGMSFDRFGPLDAK